MEARDYVVAISMFFCLPIHQFEFGGVEWQLHLIELGEGGVVEPHSMKDVVGVDVEESWINTIDALGWSREGEFLEEEELVEGQSEEDQGRKLTDHSEVIDIIYVKDVCYKLGELSKTLLAGVWWENTLLVPDWYALGLLTMDHFVEFLQWTLAMEELFAG